MSNDPDSSFRQGRYAMPFLRRVNFGPDQRQDVLGVVYLGNIRAIQSAQLSLK